jgi:GntR family transcriptional regulator
MNIPDYRRVLNALAERIDDGTYPLRSKLPSLKQMREEFGVSYSTIQTALRILEDRHVIAARRGAGYYVIAETGQRHKTASPEPGSPDRPQPS